MMISLSENEDVVTVSARSASRKSKRLLDARARETERLEFFPLNRPEVLDEMHPNTELACAETLLKQEVAELDGQLRSYEEQLSARVEAERSAAKTEARRDWEVELKERIAEERNQVLKIANQFRIERERYFSGVESEVVKLALAIAARVLHREAQVDPLLLAGVVRVALERISDSSAVKLHIPPSELPNWQEAFKANDGSSLELVGDDQLESGKYVLDTSVGTIELGIKVQLEEIERGLFDLMQQRPA
jgi:flagellar assembly protein FliH